MLVELDVFSGRPNPRWTLDEDSAASLRELLSRLTVAAGPPPPQPGLGYRGFLVAVEGDRLRAYRGYVIGPEVVLADPGSSVERFLVDRLPPALADLRERVPLDGDG